MSRICRRRVPKETVLTTELCKTIAQISFELKKELSILMTRNGKIEGIYVGSMKEFPFDNVISRSRQSKVRLRGYRLIHTHLKKPELSQDELVTLVNERLDLICSVEVKPDGQPGKIQIANIVPPNPHDTMWNVSEYADVGRVDTNFDELVSDLETEIERAYGDYGGREDKEGVFLVGFSTESKLAAEESIKELRELAVSADKIVLDEIVQAKRRQNPRFLIGKGKLQEIILKAKQVGADTLIFDVELTPAQVKAITDYTNLGVMDRTQLILEIFASRAKSSEGKIQVQLAQLKYMLPRLTGKGIELSQLGGGIGTRGPGEKKLEEQRRMLRKRIGELEKEISKISKRRASGRKHRTETGIPTVTLIGYTSVGKSTLFNTITRSGVLVAKKLFSTLTPTTRRMMLPSGKFILLTDTVGFIRDLPSELLKAFKATLEELGESTCLVHMVDAADTNFENKIEAVEDILEANGYDDIPRLLVFNKVDKISEVEAHRIEQLYNVPTLSALDKETFHGFLTALDEIIAESTVGLLDTERNYVTN